MKATLIEAEGGEQIVVFPPGFEIDADEVELVRDGARLILRPLPRAEGSENSES